MKSKAIIIGDSYSTFEGYIPEGYFVYYTKADPSQSGVTDVSQTWWSLLAAEAELDIVLNNSWSGSTIGYTGYDNSDCSRSSSFIYRLRELKEKGFFAENEIEKVFVFGGTNDSWSNAPLGEAGSEACEEKDLFFVLPAIGHFLKELKQTLPRADIYCLINTEIKPEIAECLHREALRHGITPVSFEHIDKVCGHPTLKGMQDIKNGVLRALK